MHAGKRIADYWPVAKQLLMDSQFLIKLKSYDRDNINVRLAVCAMCVLCAATVQPSACYSNTCAETSHFTLPPLMLRHTTARDAEKHDVPRCEEIVNVTAFCPCPLQPRVIDKIRKEYVADTEFTSANAAKASSAAEGLCK